ncbi:F-box protein At2g26160 [Ziziphus jujuba]|uniref:F-box protein At2g26160 n=1 Tax=Ziziphus jujuba TaxID=326968 RepID=A0A6P4AAN1_ZIZJJ|nr:F-box protein At2g26160 [Ziziphus jujuba]
MGKKHRMANWAELPKELWENIAKLLQTPIDVIRFRSVCKSWRFSILPNPTIQTPSLPLGFHVPGPDPFAFTTVSVSQTRLFHVQPSTLSSSSSSKVKGWLVKLQDSDSGKMRLFLPFNPGVRHFPRKSQEVLNLLDFRVVELGISYALTFSMGFSSRSVSANKVVVKLDNSGSGIGFAEFASVYDGLLGFWKLGDDQWSFLAGERFYYHDIVSHKGQFYAVDRWGLVDWIDSSSLNPIQFSPRLPDDIDRPNWKKKQKHLIDSCGDIYLIDKFLDEERVWNCLEPPGLHYNYDATVVGFQVYKLDQEWGRWVEVKSLGDRAFLLSNDSSISFSTRDLAGCKRNSIYFTDNLKVSSCNCKCRVFDLEDGSIKDLGSLPSSYSEIFEPPWCWLSTV